MNYFEKIILFCFITLLSIFGFSQEVYFNNTYNLCQNYNSEAWSGADGIIKIDDGYVIAGYTVDTIDYWWRRIPILKINDEGIPIWLKSFGDTIADFYTGYPGSFLKTSNHQYYIAGSINYWQPNNFDVGLLIKMNQQFDTIWKKEYNLNHDEQMDTSILFNQMDICSNSDLIFGGSINGSYLLLWRTDSSGNTKWYKAFHYGLYTLCTGYSVIQTSDDGFALGGFMYTIGQAETGNSVIVKTNSLGNQRWVKFLGGPYLDNKAMLSRSVDSTIIMGTTYGDYMQGDDPISRICIAKLDNDGNIIWDKKYGKSCKYNYLTNVRVLNNGDIIAVGRKPDIFPHEVGWILKLKQNGDSIWYREYDNLHGSESVNNLSDVIETSDNGLIACGDVIPMAPDTGIRSAWVIKLDSIGCEWAGCDSTVGIEEEDKTVRRYDGKTGGLEVWPNPAREILNFKFSILNSGGDYSLEIYDIFGRTAPIPGPRQWAGKLSPTRGKGDEVGWTVDVAALPPGIYVAVVKNGSLILASTKFVIAR